jgi:D-alanyl-D-alanine carboxypeptidase
MDEKLMFSDQINPSLNPNSNSIDAAGRTILGTPNNDWLRSTCGHDYLNGGMGSDRLWGRAGNDTLIGGSGDDWLDGGSGDDRLFGGSGSDRLLGGNGHDRLEGGTGKDRLRGGNGNDILIDRDGGDRLAGGEGADQFGIGNGSLGATVITDFQVGQDKIEFLELGIRFDHLSLQDNPQGLTITYQGKELVKLFGVKAAKLTADSFDFGNTQLVADLQQTLNQSLQGTGSPGSTVGVVTADGRYWTGASGFSNVEQGQAANANDRFNIASVTKTFTATVIMQLVQEGKLALNDPMTKWLPSSITANIACSNEITLRQLLSMTSGIYNADPFSGNPLSGSYYQDLFNDPSLLFKDQTPTEFISKYVAGREPVFKPGKNFDYNNSNYRLLGLVIESATDGTLAQAYRERIIEPLGLQNTFLGGAETIPGGYSPSYTDINGDGKLDNTGGASLLFESASGGLVSHVQDLSRFAQGLFNGELLSPAALEELITGSGIPGLGLGIAYQDVSEQGREYISNGSGFGVQTQLRYFEETSTTTIVITNGDTNLFDADNPAARVLQSISSILRANNT